MPAALRPNLGLTAGWAHKEGGWDAPMNANLGRLDSLVHLSVKDILSTPPGSPLDGDRYIVGASPTGAWAGHAGEVATWESAVSAWAFYAPKRGWNSYVEDERAVYRYESEWFNDDLVFNVRRFLAKGDGTTDDTAAIQAAINASTDCYVFLPAGAYRITAALTSIGKKINLVGAGRDVTVILTTAAGHDGWNISSGSRMAHLTLRGPNAASAGNAGLDSGSATDVTVEDCIIEQWGDAGINTGGSSARWVIRNNIVRNNLQQGIFLGGGTNDCTISGNIVHGNSKIGIDINGSRNTIIGNIVYSNGGAGGAVDAWGILIAAITGASASDANYNVVANNTVRANGAQGIIVRPATGRTANYNTIIGNISLANTGSGGNGDGIALDGSIAGTMTGNVVVGNVCEGNQRHGIVVDANPATASNNLILGNTCISNTTTGILISSGPPTDTQVLSNTCLLNGTNLTDSGTRTVLAGNKTNTTDGYYQVGSDANLASGKVLRVNGTQVVGAQGAAVADASGGATVDIEARTAINALLARLRTHGLIAT